MNYFVAFRYQRADLIIDGNAVITRADTIMTEWDVRALEAVLAEERNVEPDALGLVSITKLE